MKPKPATLRVPVKFYDEALRFVNARRKEKKLRPIKALPAGYRGRSNSCPCAAECGGAIVVHGSGWRWVGDSGYGMDGPYRFTGYFDNSAKPRVLTLPLRGMKARRA